MKYLLCVFVLLFAIGCVTIKVNKKEFVENSKGEMVLVSESENVYKRLLGSQSLEGVKYNNPKTGTNFEIGKQTGQNRLDSVLENLTGTLENLTKIVASGGIPTPPIPQ